MVDAAYRVGVFALNRKAFVDNEDVTVRRDDSNLLFIPRSNEGRLLILDRSYTLVHSFLRNHGRRLTPEADMT